ncbi:MAG: phosphoadenosine phosphosulfate reductase [Actinobacteria bacterium]|nr:phosphoadenosine phosphosulfate reductase [Actinomycetota bacterium]
MRVFSYGGGWQSTAALALAAQGKLDYRVFLFANVGNDSENPATLDYVREVAVPFAAAHGLALHVLHRTMRDGTPETLLSRMTKPESKQLPIPVRLGLDGPPATRTCTKDFKVRVTGKWLRANGATAENPATVALGISIDEIGRANPARHEPYERIAYPLLDLRVRRSDCPGIIRASGLPVPPKSACWFCPFHSRHTWTNMRREDPAMFERAAALEDHLQARRAALGKDPVYLSDFGPLRDGIPELDVLPLEWDSDQAGCDSGQCFT